MLIIVAIVLYRVCHGRRQVSVPNLLQHPLQKNVNGLNPAHALFDQRKLQASVLLEETDLDSPYYSPLKNGYDSPYDVIDDAMIDPCSVEGNAIQELHASRRDTRYDMSPPSKINPRMHPTGDYSSLDGTQEVYARGQVIQKVVRAAAPLHLYEETDSDSPYYSSLKHGDGSSYEVIDTVMNAGKEVHGDYATLDGSQEVYARTTVVPNSAVRSDTTDVAVSRSVISSTHGRFLPVICIAVCVSNSIVPYPPF